MTGDTFREPLIAEIAVSDARGPAADAGAPGYYGHWLAALEQVLAKTGIPPAAEL